jgi:pyruvate formate lyase activating enzyme
LAYNENRCIGCQECKLCAEECPLGAIRKSETDKIVIDRELCNTCGKCSEKCPANALKMFGDPLSIDEILKISAEDDSFHSRSGGGVTISGGEPALQADFVEELLRSYHDHGIHGAIETCGHATWKDIEKVCRYSKLILYDIKTMNSEKHEIFIGTSNHLIIENFNKIAKYFPEIPIMVRTPIIPGVNDSEQDIEEIARYLVKINNVYKYELLEYHRFGEAKYAQLGRKYPFQGAQMVSRERMRELTRIADKVENCHRC